MFRVLTNLRIILASDALISLCLIVLLQRTLHCYIQIKDVISSTTFKHDHKQFGTVIQKFAYYYHLTLFFYCFCTHVIHHGHCNFRTSLPPLLPRSSWPTSELHEWRTALVILFNHLWKLIIFLLEHISISKLQTFVFHLIWGCLEGRAWCKR